MKTNQSTIEKSIEFSRSDTKALKGIAVVLMLFHHLAAFPARFPVGFTGFESLWGGFSTNDFLVKFALVSKICVSIFFFLGGYGLFIRWKSSKFSVSQSIIDLYKAYWKVFLVFVPIAILFFGRSGTNINPICTGYVFQSKGIMVTTILSDFVGLTSKLNAEWWFFLSYVCVIPLGYLYCCKVEARNFWEDIFLVFCIDILIRNIFPAIADMEVFSSLRSNLFYSNFFEMNSYTSAFFAGIVFAKHNGICKIKRILYQFHYCTLCSVLGLGILLFCRTFILGEQADIIYCAALIPMLSVILDNYKPLKQCFVFLGKHSTNMWLIHSFFCYYFLEATYLVYSTKNVWIDLLILVALSLSSSIAVNGFYCLLEKQIRKKEPVQ